MSERTTIRHLECKLEQVNRMLGTPLNPYERVNGKCVTQTGCWHLDESCGGVAVHIMAEQGGVSQPFPRGTKSEIYKQLEGVVAGIYAAEHKD